MKTIERKFDWGQDMLPWRLAKEIEYIEMYYQPEKIVIERGENIEVHYKEDDNQ